MKRVLLGLAALLVLAALAIGLSIDRIAGAAIERGASAALGVETRVGFVRLALLDSELRVSRLRIANPPGFSDDPFLAFDRFELKADLRSLRGERVDVPLFLLEGIDVSLERRGRETNTDAIFANLKRFESGGAQPAEAEPAGPPQRFRVERLVIRDITAHVEWSSLASRESALEIRIDGIELERPGGERGLTLPELSNVVVKAVLDSVRRSGKLPLEVANDIAGGLRGLARIPGALTGGALERAGEALDDALRGAGEALGGLFGGKEER
jgi:hypothetical protein